MTQRSLPLLPLVAALALAAPTSALAAQPESKIFRDWAAACDNLGGCAALSLLVENASRIAYLALERPAGPAGAPSLALKLRAEKLKAPLAVQLALDGAAFPAPGKSFSATVADEETAMIRFAPAEVDTLLAAARKASRLTLRFGKADYAVSLAGSVAALLWIDERQGRLGTVTALIRKGDAPAATVPAAAAVPVVTARPAAAGQPGKDEAKTLGSRLRARLKASDPDACEEESETVADQLWRLDAGTRLIALSCSRGGAYNLTSAFWLVTGDDVAKARKVVFERPGAASDNQLINADFDVSSGKLDFFGKGRGVGDCGSAGSYAWTGTGFTLTSYSEMPECRGLAPEDWLTLWRSTVKTEK